MFEKRREIRQANHRHAQLMRIADQVTAWRYGPVTDGEIAELATVFIGRAFAARNEAVDVAEAVNYVTASLAKRGYALPATA